MIFATIVLKISIIQKLWIFLTENIYGKINCNKNNIGVIVKMLRIIKDNKYASKDNNTISHMMKKDVNVMALIERNFSEKEILNNIE